MGSQREFGFKPKDHVELGLALDIFDFDKAAEVQENMTFFKFLVSHFVFRLFLPHI